MNLQSFKSIAVALAAAVLITGTAMADDAPAKAARDDAYAAMTRDMQEAHRTASPEMPAEALPPEARPKRRGKAA